MAGQSVGGLHSINSAPDEKRHWWEWVCNTAQAGGEDSASDPNGCRGCTVSALGS